MKRMKIWKFFGLSLCSLFILLLWSSIGQAMDLPKVIDKTNCAQYKELLVPALYRAVERGGFVVTPGKINFTYKLPDSFIAAGKKNAGKFDINSEGDLVEKSTGKIPINIYGFPFPNIDLKDANAGRKMISNFNYKVYRFMASAMKRPFTWINTSGIERYVDGLDYRLYMSGRPPGQEITKNPSMVRDYHLSCVLDPMSMKGTNTLDYVFYDKRDDVNYAYVPAIRRIRQTGSTTRSDPYMGSDGWLDLNFMWCGKDRSMKWKYVGEKTILVGFTYPDTIHIQENPDGSYIPKYPYTGRFIKLGFQVPGWKGDAWAPAPDAVIYVPRKVWVVEQVPKDPYYNWGLHVNYIDQETYTIWYKEIYDKSGAFRTWCSMYVSYSETPSGNNNVGDFDLTIYLDEKNHHASISHSINDPRNIFYAPASRIAPDFFTVNNFLMLSK